EPDASRNAGRIRPRGPRRARFALHRVPGVRRSVRRPDSSGGRGVPPSPPSTFPRSNDVGRARVHHHERTRAFSRVFMGTRAAVAVVRAVGSKPFGALWEWMRADGHETLEADCQLKIRFERMPSLRTDSAAA